MSTLQHPSPPTGPADARSSAAPAVSPNPERATAPVQRQLLSDARDVARGVVTASLDGRGAVILGAPGIGKTTLAREAAERYGGFQVQLRGSNLSAQTPYGALAWLLSDLPAAELANPVQVLRALEALLLRQAAGRRIIMVIDNAEEIDELAVLVTSELCRRGTVALLLICGDLIRCHQEYVRLWTDGSLKRLDLAPLDPVQTGELLAKTAGGPLTTRARQMLWQQSRGNPLLASLLCRDHIAAKSLVHRRGFWTWAGPPVHTGELLERVEAVLRRFTGEERRAVEILALCRELPLATVLQLVPAHTLDSLEEGSVVTINGGHGQPVRLAWHLQPATIAARIPFGRSRDLWSEMTRVVDPTALTAATAAGLADWSLSVGIAPEGPSALAAARWANETGDTDAALRYARAVVAPRPLAVLLEEADALRAEGKHTQAHRVLAAAETGRAGNPDDAPAELRLRLLIGRALAAARTPGCWDNPELLLERAERLLPEDTGAQPGPTLEVTLARAELLSLAGRFSEMPASLADDFADPAVPAARRLWAGIRCAQQSAAAGRFAEAASLAGQVRNRLAAGIQADVRTREQLFHHLFFLLIQCGELGAAQAMTSAAADPGNSSGLCTSTGTELPLGLVHAYAGRCDVALEFLQPALAQLESHDPDGMLPLAAAAAAYCGLLKRETGSAADLQSPPEAQDHTDPGTESAQRYFRLLASRAYSPPAAADELYLFASDALKTGDVPSALLGFSAAAVSGHRAAAQDLAAAAEAADGAPADMYAHLAAGLLNDDVPALIMAAEAALRQRNSLLGHAAAQAARELADGGSNRALLRRARQLEYRSFRTLSPRNSVEHGLSQLGDFERDLALRAAAGETSADLGRRFHLSARTVDWHLGRVFARLHVVGRTDLQNVLTKRE
ncbi:AAA family ATPase [Arthrobacter sp. zg-Y1219]|uniref:AAA family ATPase n=1 Tax=Arthrobacter sp. zg-Y1219 TaxID=3049067 RepID=UPI0024C4339E|nr:AAA family ATPase [Arthrobacter sp. zg-Y1219]MDK1360158.1 AAA family ATPase [Arthrobacter sp. zg-Y1219]